jgi:hypothetical protein
MSNPSINRWGLNLFWYKMWFTDKLQQLYIQQDNIFEKLIYFYLYYGFRHPFNIFKHFFWHPSFLIDKAEHQTFNQRYERVCSFEDKFLNETIDVTLRNKTRDFFSSKIWLLRYQRWILINFFTFQPIKKKFTNKNFRGKNFSSLTTEQLSYNTNVIKRFKLLFLYSAYLANFNYYKF